VVVAALWYINTVSNVVNLHAPLKIASRKQRRLMLKPWIIKEIYTLICYKQKLYKADFKRGDPCKIDFKNTPIHSLFT